MLSTQWLESTEVRGTMCHAGPAADSLQFSERTQAGQRSSRAILEGRSRGDGSPEAVPEFRQSSLRRRTRKSWKGAER